MRDLIKESVSTYPVFFNALATAILFKQFACILRCFRALLEYLEGTITAV